MSDTELPDNRVVAFIDILGFRALIRRVFEDGETLLFGHLLAALKQMSRESPAAQLSNQWRLEVRKAHETSPLRELMPSLNTQANDPDPDLQATAFSDSLVISDLLNPQALGGVIENARRLAATLLEKGILCRGGIAAGPTYHRDGIVCGAGLISAYQLERDVARYPRIVLSDKLPVSQVLLFDLPVIQDFDGCSIIDVFSAMRLPQQFGDIKDLASWLKPGPPDLPRLERVRKVIEDSLRSHGAESGPSGVTVKYRWLARRFNAALVSMEVAEIPPLSL